MSEINKMNLFVQYGITLWDWRIGLCRLFWCAKKPCTLGMPLPDQKWSHIRIVGEEAK